MENEKNIIPESLKEELDKNMKYLNPSLQKIHESVKESLELSDFNIQEKSLVASSIHHSYLTLLYQHKAILKRLEEALEKKEKLYIEKYGKKEIAKYKIAGEVKQLDDVKKIEKKIEEEKEIIRYLVDVNKILSAFGFTIKNSVDLLKMEN